LKFADDVDLIEDNHEVLQQNINLLGGAANSAGLKINIGKTKTMVFGQKDIENQITEDGTQIQNVEQFEYLGSLITWDNNCSAEIKWRIAKSHGAMTGFSTIWKS
jgi:hypothetical protein